MANAKPEPRLQVELPPPAADQPAWGRVGLIALGGFVIGVIWPRLAGVQLGPSPPADARPSPPPSSAPAKPTASQNAAPSLVAVKPAGSGPVPAEQQTVQLGAIEHGKCRDAKGHPGDKCDDLAVEQIFGPKLIELSRCPSAIGLAGKMSIGFDVDFGKKTIKVQRAKGKLPKTTLDGITRCTEKGLAGLSLDDVKHDQQRYSFTVPLTFFLPGQAPAAEPEAPKPEAAGGAPAAAGGEQEAEIVWNNCTVRDAPKNGSPVGRAPKGSKVKILEQKDNWYRIEWGDKKQGWVFKGAIGK